MSEDDAGKDHEASQRKLDQAREKGEIVRSPDMLTAGSYAGLLLAGVSLLGDGLRQAGQAAATLLDQAGPLSTALLHGAPQGMMGLVLPILAPLWPMVALPALGAVLALTLTRGWLFTPDKLGFKLARISPLSIAKQKFGRNGLFEFAKSVVKLTIVAVLLGKYLIWRVDHILGAQALSAAAITVVLLKMIVEFLALVLFIATIVGGLDLLWQWFEHRRRNRMTRQEVTDEAREQDGDPHQKAARRQRGYEIATNRMLADVATADVVVVNPTHYAVALKWSRADRHAPVCVAKGTDEIAARIRERAQLAAVPIHSDPPAARALHASVDIGDEIRPEHYRAVAAAVRFAEAMRKRAGTRK